MLLDNGTASFCIVGFEPTEGTTENVNRSKQLNTNNYIYRFGYCSILSEVFKKLHFSCSEQKLRQ